MISHNVDVGCVGLGANTNLLTSLKQHVVELASNIGVLNTIQSAAQATLQAGWSILLPTADERAKTLSALLPGTGNMNIQSSDERISPEMRTSIWSEAECQFCVCRATHGAHVVLH
jgi:E3 ubiquitin-protein ligase HERC2